MQDAALMERYVIAHKLGRFKYEIDQMPVSELMEWRQYFAEVDRQERKARRV